MTKIQVRLRDWETIYPEEMSEPEGSLYTKAAEYIDALEHDCKESKDFIKKLIRDVSDLSYKRGYLEGLLQTITDWVEQNDYEPEWLPKVKEYLDAKRPEN